MPGILMTDPFTGDAFSLVTLTKAINIIPVRLGRLLQSGIFTPRGIETRTVVIERMHQTLRLLTSKPRGTQGDQLTTDKRDVVTLQVPHYPLQDRIIPEEYANRRAFGSGNALEQANQVMLRHQIKARRIMELVWEWMMWGAIKGRILDGNGATMHDLYAAFGFSKKTVHFELDDPETDVREKCWEVTRHIEDNLQGDVSNGVMAPVATDYFDALIRHPSVEKYYVNHLGAMQEAQRDPRSGFVFGGITFVEVRDNATTTAGQTVRFVADGAGHAIPLGTQETFDFVFAPGDFLEAVNTEGQPIYYSLTPLDHDKGYDIWCETNPLPICLRPNVLVELAKI